jgi:hypothetical protein
MRGEDNTDPDAADPGGKPAADGAGAAAAYSARPVTASVLAFFTSLSGGELMLLLVVSLLLFGGDLLQMGKKLLRRL